MTTPLSLYKEDSVFKEIKNNIVNPKSKKLFELKSLEIFVQGYNSKYNRDVRPNMPISNQCLRYWLCKSNP